MFTFPNKGILMTDRDPFDRSLPADDPYPQLTDADLTTLDDDEFAKLLIAVDMDYRCFDNTDPIDYIHGFALDFDKARDEMIRRMLENILDV
jgi:hypothetical protein